MTVYRVYGTCSNWECKCECTMKTFAEKTDAENYLAQQTKKTIATSCDFCRYTPVEAEIEELNVE